MALTKAQFTEIFPDVPADLEVEALEVSAIPTHIAAIMDGNGRWAEARGLPRQSGHKAGVKGVREMITACNDIGVKYLTIYSFSTENWNRPLMEVTDLMGLFAQTMTKELTGLHKENVRIKLLGHIGDLPKNTREIFLNAVEETKGNTGMTLAIAVNYGGRLEITDAVRDIARDVKNGLLSPDEIDEALISEHLYTAGMPDPDLLIRTSGEYRLSNFLLWQIAYSEIYVTDVYWPDFDRYELLRALLDFQRRNRRFGGVR